MRNKQIEHYYYRSIVTRLMKEKVICGLSSLQSFGIVCKDHHTQLHGTILFFISEYISETTLTTPSIYSYTC